MKRERCPMCLADDVDGADDCRRCGVRFERSSKGRIVRAYRSPLGRSIWQLVFQRRSNSADCWSEGFTESPPQARVGRLRIEPL